MSLIINGMNLPSECSECLFSCYDISVGEPAQCIILGEHSARHSRLKNCPLTEIPTPHGRLIDADAHIKLLKENHCGERCRRNHDCFSCGIDMYIRIIENEPTVIKAEGDNE